MPVAENRKTPRSTQYGEGTAREAMVEATTPTESPVAAPETPMNEPALELQAPPVLEQKPPTFSEELVAGKPLDPDAAQALFQPSSGVSPQDVFDAAEWAPMFEYMASQPGASEYVKALAAAAKRSNAQT